MKKKPTLYLVDASSFIFRAFFAIRRLSNSKGLPTNAIFGFTTMLLGVFEKEKPDYVACVFDTAQPTFRKEMFSEYKANRGAPPDDLIPQFEHIHRVVESLGYYKIDQAGFEADDVIATLAKRFSGECEVVIVTGDKDLMQLVTPEVRILDTMKSVWYGPAEVKQKMGVGPELITDFLGLTGDSSDNIPGVAGIGPKTAVDMLTEHGSLEGVIKAIPKMKAGKRKDVLEQSIEVARLSKKLATVQCDVPGEASKVSLEALAAPAKTRVEFVEFLREMEFRTLEKKYAELLGSGSSRSELTTGTSDSSQAAVSIATPIEDWNAFLEKAKEAQSVAFHVSSASLRTKSLKAEKAYFCIDGKTTHELVFQPSQAKSVLHDMLKQAVHQNWAGYDLKDFFKICLAEGVPAPLLDTSGEKGFFDVLVAHYLVTPEEKHELEALIQKYGGVVPPEDAPFDPAVLPCIAGIFEDLQEQLNKNNLRKLFWEMEMPLCRVLAQMEYDGVCVDTQILESLSNEYAKELEGIEKEIFDVVGYTFNLNSPKQLSEVLFTKLGLPVVQKTKTGFSTDISVLEKLAPLHPVPALIVRYRELTKLKNTYLDVIPALLENDGRLHARFNQAVAATGRLSSSDPNLQNIPIKTESGRKIRKAFVAEKGNVLVGADYSQIELRIVAHLSGDPALIKAFQSEQDVHRLTAAEIFHVEPAAVTDRQRAAAKAINFGLIYGKTAFGLSQELSIPRHEAQSYIDAYFERYSGVKKFMDACLQEARTHKAVKTVFGRVRPIKDIDSKNVGVRNNAERMAMNTPVQGTAADVMKLAMIAVAKACPALQAKLVLSVHDELVLEVPRAQAASAEAVLKKEMEGVAEFSVKLCVDSAQANDWMDL